MGIPVVATDLPRSGASTSEHGEHRARSRAMPRRSRAAITGGARPMPTPARSRGASRSREANSWDRRIAAMPALIDEALAAQGCGRRAVGRAAAPRCTASRAAGACAGASRVAVALPRCCSRRRCVVVGRRRRCRSPRRRSRPTRSSCSPAASASRAGRRRLPGARQAGRRSLPRRATRRAWSSRRAFVSRFSEAEVMKALAVAQRRAAATAIVLEEQAGEHPRERRLQPPDPRRARLAPRSCSSARRTTCGARC